MNTMEQTKQPLDLRTLFLLMIEHEEVPWDNIMDLIAEEVNIPSDQLKTTLAKKARSAGVSTRGRQDVEMDFKPSRDTGSNKRTYSRWEDARLDELVQRWNDGQKPGQIAKDMGVSTQTVYQKISRLRKTRDDIQARKSRNPAFSSKGSQGS
jgi:hypothetical protein